MDNPKTMEELINGMDDLAMNLEWKADEFNAVVYFMHDKGNTYYNMFGNGNAMVNALLNMMLKDEKFRRVIFAANESYLSYMARHSAPKIEAIVKTIEDVHKSILNTSDAELMPCLFSAKFKPKS